MPTANLFLVTDTLRRLLQFNVEALILRETGVPQPINVTAMPPERAGGVTDTLNLHLYHAMEDGHYKNIPPPGSGGAPVARQPLALSLFYILTAHHELNETWDASNQQRLFSLAIKTMHDHALISDALQIAADGMTPQTVMASGLEGRGNHFEISPRPLTPEESMNFWSAEQNATTRLSAYYEVRTVFLEPEEPTSTSGRVYDLGLYVAPILSPVIEAVSALTVFTPPAATGLPQQVLETMPARAVLDPGAVPEVNRVRAKGSGLTGDGSPGGAQVVLRTPAWRDLPTPVRDVAIDPVANPAWAVQITETEARFDLQGSVSTVVDGAPASLEVSPGIYAVAVRNTRRQVTDSGVTRTTTSESNQVAFSVGAHVAQVTGPNPNGRFDLQVTNTFDMTASGLDAQLSVDGDIYDETASFSGTAATDRGSFVRQPGQIEFHPLFNPAVAAAHPVRLVLNGAESQPFWFDTP